MSTNDPMTQEQLDAIQERLDAATPGPWAVDSDDPAYIIYPEKGGWDGLVIAHVAEQDGALFPVEHNGSLIANAPQDLADLLAEVERLRALIAVDDAMVERGARAFYEHPTPGVDVSLTPGWDRLTATSPDIATAYRNRIRAALDAAHNPGMWS